MVNKLAGRLACALALLAAPGIASAQVAAVDDTARLADGFVVGENSIMHATAGVEFGYISNVFYEEGDEQSSGIFRAIVGLDIGTIQAEDGSPPTDTSYSFDLKLTYNEFISSQDNVQAQRDLGATAGLSAEFFRTRDVGLKLENKYTRSVRPTNFEASDNLQRSVNQAKATVSYQPQGRTIEGQFFYQNTIDAFETSDTSFANRLQHLFGLRANWEYLPQTKFHAQLTQGIFGALGDGNLNGMPYIVDAYPLAFQVGADSAITELVTASVYAGWNLGFYESGATYNSPMYGAGVAWRYTPLGRLKLRFDREFRDSINSNFYSDYAIVASVEQQLLDSLNASGQAGVRWRSYEGIPDVITTMTDDRSDNIFSVQGSLNYAFRDLFSAGVAYNLSVVDTEFRYSISNDGLQDDPSFTRQEIVGTLTVEY